MFADHPAHDAHLSEEQHSEEHKEDEECQCHAARLYVGDSRKGWHHVLYCPWLSAQLSHNPSCLARNIGKWQHDDGRHMEPTARLRDVSAPCHMADDEEEKQQ